MRLWVVGMHRRVSISASVLTHRGHKHTSSDGSGLSPQDCGAQTDQLMSAQLLLGPTALGADKQQRASAVKTSAARLGHCCARLCSSDPNRFNTFQ